MPSIATLILICIIFLFTISQIIRMIIFSRISDPKLLKDYPKEVETDNYLDKMYDRVLEKEQDESDVGMYYDKLSGSFLFDVNESHNAFTFKNTIMSSPSEFNYLLADLNKMKDKELVILDCGCGVGGLSFYLASQLTKAKIVAITNSQKQYEIVRQKILDKHLENRMTVAVIDFDKIMDHLEKNTFDYIFFVESHGYSKDRLKLFKNVNDLLKVGGKLYIRTPAFQNSNSEIMKELQRKEIKFWRYNFSNRELIMNDLLNVGFSVKYKTISSFTALLVAHIIDIIKGTLFCILCLNYSLRKAIESYIIKRLNVEILVVVATKK